MSSHAQIKTLNRNLSVDVYRLLAGFCIVFLHVGYEDYSPQIVDLVRLWGRWCVPFFFMLSGYFLNKKLTKVTDSISELLNQLFKILKIICIANLIFILLELLTKGGIEWRSLFPAAHYHLWFLPSLCLGSVAVFLQCYWHVKPSFVFCISAILIFFVLGFDSYRMVLGMNPGEMSGKVMPLLSIPFMFLGSYFASRKFKAIEERLLPGLTLIVVGFFLQIFEARFILESSGKPIMELQFLFGTIFLTIGFFFVAFSVDGSCHLLSKWGRKLSLFIYLYHPLLIFTFYKTGVNTVFPKNLQLLFPVVVFFATFFLGIVLNNRYKKVFQVLNGDFALETRSRFDRIKIRYRAFNAWIQRS